MPLSPFEILSKRSQNCISETPVIILGSGASIGAGIPGMGALREHLLNIPAPSDCSPEELKPWQRFKDTLKHTDLESALQSANLPEKLDILVATSSSEYPPSEIRASVPY